MVNSKLKFSLFDGARRVRRHLDGASHRCDVVVVYGGGWAQRRTDGSLVPWHKLHQAGL